MKHLLNHLEIPLLFLNTELRVQQFSNAATAVVHLIDADVGRPIDHIATKLTENGFVDAAREAASTGRHTQRQVRTADGSWYRMIVGPYHDPARVLQGVIVSFVNVDAEKAMGRELEGARKGIALLQATVDAMEPAVLVLDSSLRIESSQLRVLPDVRGPARTDRRGVPPRSGGESAGSSAADACEQGSGERLPCLPSHARRRYAAADVVGPAHQVRR